MRAPADGAYHCRVLTEREVRDVDEGERLCEGAAVRPIEERLIRRTDEHLHCARTHARTGHIERLLSRSHRFGHGHLLQQHYVPRPDLVAVLVNQPVHEKRAQVQHEDDHRHGHLEEKVCTTHSDRFKRQSAPSSPSEVPI